MSNKFEVVKKAVFYAEQNPSALAEIIAGTITDVATTVKVSGASSIPVATTGTANTSTYTAEVRSQYDDIMDGASVTFALKAAVTGVSVNSGTGVVSVANTATATSATVTATSSGVVGEKTIVLLVPTTVVASGADSIEVPSGETPNTAKYTAVVKDQNGDEIENASVTFSLKTEVTGVSVSGDTVSVANTAVAESFILVATCNSASVEKTVALASE